MKRPGVRRLFRFPFRTREHIRADVDEEFQFHLDMRISELVRAGLTEPAARAQALREFGGRTAAARACVEHGDQLERRRRVARILGDFRQDVILGVRILAKSPGITLAAVLTLAVAIGGNTAIFSIANALLLKPLPVAAPQELGRIRAGQSQMSWPNYQDIRERNEVFTDIVAHRRLVSGLATANAPVRLWGEQTSHNYFSVLGVSAALGRTFLPSDTRRDLVVLSDRVWRARFGAEASVLGRLVTLNGRPFEVVGVMPPVFRGVAPGGASQDFWVPFDDSPRNLLVMDRGSTRFEVFGRLKPGVTHAAAAGAMRVVGQQIKAEYPDLPESFVRMDVFRMDGIDAFRGMADLILPVLGFLALMTVVAGFVLLIGCANIAGLLIGRAAARRKEIGVRLALGASRGRLVRQFLTESLLLAVVGGAAGVLLSAWLTAGVNPFFSRLPIPIALDLQLDSRVLMFALAASTLTTLLFGLAPARRATRVDLIASLRDESGGAAVRQRLRRGLVIGQVAVCSLLLVWSGLFLRSLANIANVNPGFDSSSVLLAGVELDEATHDSAFGQQFFADLQQRVAATPGVESAGAASVVPLSLNNEEFDVIPRGDDGAPQARRRVLASRLTPGWFDTVRIQLMAGRDFTWDDREGAPGVVIVNETLAKQFWNGQALGKLIQLPQPEQRAVVVGIVRDSKYWTLGEAAAPTVYLPLRQGYFRMMTLHVRTADMQGTTRAIQREMANLAPGVFVDITPMSDAVSIAVLPAQIGASVTGAFGIVAILLAALGIHALVAFSVTLRTREIGVRKAIGASTSDLIRLVLGENIVLTATGLSVGLALGALGGNLLRSFIAGVSPVDPVTLGGVAGLVIASALVASAAPAVRAARVNPLVVLRDA